MIYSSDHGEFLGENRVYLHGLPRFLAPPAQTQIPALAWFSDRFIEENLNNLPLSGTTQINYEITHDNISATLLGMFDVETTVYNPELDIFKYKTAVTLTILD